MFFVLASGREDTNKTIKFKVSFFECPTDCNLYMKFLQALSSTKMLLCAACTVKYVWSTNIHLQDGCS